MEVNRRGLVFRRRIGEGGVQRGGTVLEVDGSPFWLAPIERLLHNVALVM